MATTLDKSKQIDMAGLALKVKDVDASGAMDVTGNLNVTGNIINLTGVLSRGAGVDTAESYATSITRSGTLITTRIVVDISTLIGSATDLDIIGESAAADCHWGQITVAKCGTIIGGKVQCLEAPAGGSTDIDFYSATVSTGTQDVDVTTLTETALVTSGGAWTTGTSKGMTTVPPANDYLYICNGAASGGTFTAGKFEITLYGYSAT